MSDLADRLDWLATYLRDEDLVYNDKAFGLRDEIKKAADRLRKMEAVREAAIAAKKRFGYVGEVFDEVGMDEALAVCGDECEHVWLHNIRPLTTKENRCTLCGEPKR